MKPTLKIWLLASFATAILFFALDRAEAQRTFSGSRPGGSFSGTRPGGATGVTGMNRPGGATGITGGVTGMNRPGTSIGGGSSFSGGTGFSGGIGGGKIETVWSCKKCGRELGRGSFPPASATCSCGITYNNGIGFDKGSGQGGVFGGNAGAIGTPPGGMNPPMGMGGQQPGINQPVVGNQLGNPDIGFGGMTRPTTPPVGSGVPAEVDRAAKTVTGGMIAGGIATILFGLAILGSVVFLVMNNGKEYSGPARRRSRD